MKKLFGVVAVVALVVPLVAAAAEFRAGKEPGVGTSEYIRNDVYLAGGSVTSAGTIIGDLVAAGGTVVVSGNVSSDVAAGGGNVAILSDVGDDVRAAGGNIFVEGTVGGDVLAAGGSIMLGGKVGGDVAAAGGSVRIDAPIAGSVHAAGGSVYLNAPITGDITVDADTLTLGSDAIINGTLTYQASKELTKKAGAVVRGEVQFTPRHERPAPAAAWAAVASLATLGKFLALLVCALVIGLVFRRYSKEVLARVVERPWLELGRGFLVLAATPVLAILLCVTLVGIPLGVLGFIGYVAALILAWVMASIITGAVVYRYVFKGTWDVSWKTILLGAVLYSLAGFVPFVGWLVQCLLVVLSLGAVVGILVSAIKEWR